MMTSFKCGPGIQNAGEKTAQLAPVDFRSQVRQGVWQQPTAGCCPGFAQMNLVVLPEIYATDFQDFCKKNPKPCPLLETVPNGRVEAIKLAPGSDLRSDCPGYRVFRGQQIESVHDVTDIWQEDFVSFLIGCSFTFEQAMLKNAIPVRHIELGCNVPMFVTDIPCKSVGPFSGQMVVSMRPIPALLVEKTYTVTGAYPSVHGAPVYHGDPEAIGICDLSAPDFGEPVPVGEGEIPVFWACGVTPQIALMNLAPEIAITHAPGYMFVSDLRDEEFFVG